MMPTLHASAHAHPSLRRVIGSTLAAVVSIGLLAALVAYVAIPVGQWFVSGQFVFPDSHTALMHLLVAALCVVAPFLLWMAVWSWAVRHSHEH